MVRQASFILGVMAAVVVVAAVSRFDQGPEKEDDATKSVAPAVAVEVQKPEQPVVTASSPPVPEPARPEEGRTVRVDLDKEKSLLERAADAVASLAASNELPTPASEVDESNKPKEVASLASAGPTSSANIPPIRLGEGESLTEMIVLAVDKKKLVANLSTWPENFSDTRLLKTFRIATGKVEGDKQREGDNKTPEGIYFAQRHKNDAELPAKYGAKAIPINFPNPMDRIHKKTGYGIWLHGVDNDQRIEEAKVTEGCVAFYNPDISSLATWLQPRQGVVVIAESLNDVNRSVDLEAVRAQTNQWIDAWAQRDMKRYISFYDQEFRYKQHNRKSYEDYKSRVFRSYKKMTVSLRDLRIVTHPKYAVAMFNQDFFGDSHFKSIGRKLIYWTKSSDGQWKIRAEVFENQRFEFSTYTAAELASLTSSTIKKR